MMQFHYFLMTNIHHEIQKHVTLENRALKASLKRLINQIETELRASKDTSILFKMNQLNQD